MAKPTDLPNWATDANYPAGVEPEAGTPTTVEPASGKQATGWRPGEPPKAQSLNWWQNLVYLWMAYLNSGNLEGDHTIDGSLELTSHVEATHLYHTAARRCVVGAAEALDPNGTHTLQASGTVWTLASSTNRIIYPMRVVVGEVITSFTFYLVKNTSALYTMEGRLYRRYFGGAEAQVGATASDSSNGSGGALLIELATTGLSHTVEIGYQYYLVLTPPSLTGDFAYHADFTVTRPAP